MNYVALLRGINVGGNNMIKMAELKEQLESAGLQDVRTYIQSGNILFRSDEKQPAKLTTLIEKVITDKFNLQVPAVVLTQKSLETIAADTPEGWLEDPAFKYNYIFLKPPYDMDKVIASIGTLKPDIESVTPAEGVLYQSISIKLFGRATTGKLASMPVYKLMTIRNHNTVTKLVALLKEF